MNTITLQTRLNTSPRRQAGLSLVELMISLTISLFLLAGITTLIVQQSNSRNELEKSSRAIENGRYAMQLLHNDIQHAGYYGDYSPSTGVTYTVPSDPCNLALGSANSGWLTAPTVPVAIFGYAGAATDPTAATTCGLTNYQANTAILVIRRASTTQIAAAAAVAGSTYLQANRCSTTAGSLFVFGTSGFTLNDKTCAAPAPLNRYIVHVYYISTCDICSPSDGIPTLKMVELGDGANTILPLTEGIENIQYDYGIDSTADGSPNTYSATPLTTDWANVMSVRVNLLARNIDATAGYVDGKSYQLGSVAVAAKSDNYKRHAYTELVRAVNPSELRE